MNLDQLAKMWEIDGKVSLEELDQNAADIAKLHNKYYELYVKEGLKLKQLKHNHAKLFRAKYDYYGGRMTDEELDVWGWEPQQFKIVRGDIPIYIESDDDIIHSNQKIEYRKAVVDYLESIVGSIKYRGHDLKTALEFLKFKAGYG